MFPAERVDLADVEKFAWGTIRFGSVPDELTLETDSRLHELGQFFDRDIFAGTDVDDCRVVVGFHEEYAGTAHVVDMEEFAHG